MCSYCFKDFLGNTKKHYKAELEAVDFMNNSEAARLNINDWVDKETQGGYYIHANTHTYQYVQCSV